MTVDELQSDDTTVSSQDLAIIGKKGQHGRERGLMCVCKCCGEPGTYTKSCGKKHICQRGLCTDKVNSWLQFFGKSDSAPMFQISCATCQHRTVFEVPEDETTVYCDKCDAKMVIRTVPVMEDDVLDLGLVVGDDAELAESTSLPSLADDES